MTHDELLERIDELELDVGDSGMNEEHKASYALRAVVERHFPFEYHLGDVISEIQCAECNCKYPCKTVKDIEKELR